MGLDPVALVLLGWAGASATKVGLAPANAAASVLEEMLRPRFERFFRVLGDKAGDRPIEANDRVKAKILAEVAFTDDEIVTEYLAGVVAASASDDAGVAVAAQISRLSAVQLRFHYVVYRELRRLWPDPKLNLYVTSEARQAGLRFPVSELNKMVSAEDWPSLLPTLEREGLINDWYKIGLETVDGEEVYTARLQPSALGAELYLWGVGMRNRTARLLIDPTSDLPEIVGIPSTPGVTLLKPPAVAPTPAEHGGAIGQ